MWKQSAVSRHSIKSAYQYQKSKYQFQKLNLKSCFGTIRLPNQTCSRFQLGTISTPYRFAIQVTFGTLSYPIGYETIWYAVPGLLSELGNYDTISSKVSVKHLIHDSKIVACDSVTQILKRRIWRRVNRTPYSFCLIYTLPNHLKLRSIGVCMTISHH